MVRLNHTGCESGFFRSACGVLHGFSPFAHTLRAVSLYWSFIRPFDRWYKAGRKTWAQLGSLRGLYRAVELVHTMASSAFSPAQ